MARVAFVTKAGRPVVFQARRNPDPADRIGTYRGHAVWVGPGGISIGAPSLGLRGYATARELERAIDRELAKREKAKATRNPSRRQRDRSFIKHKAAERGLKDRALFRGELAEAKRRERSSGMGRLRAHKLKAARRRAAPKLASQLVGVVLG